MKKLYYLFALVLITLASCENHKIIEHTADVYLYNQLDKTVKIDIFSGEGMSTCEVAPNDSTLLQTIKFTIEEGVNYGIYPGESAYDSFVYGVNKVIVYYGSNKYTYTKENSQVINELLTLERYWEVHLTKEKQQKFGWE
jgi:hypothetical protein